MQLAAYQHADRANTIQVFEKAFADSEGSQEGARIGRLVVDILETTQPQDVYGFVAKDKGQIVAAIFFTRLWFATPLEAFILSPVAVHTDYHGQGIGQALIRHGLDNLKDDGVTLAFTYGDPDFYSRVGYQAIDEDLIQAPLPLSMPHGWLAQKLDGNQLEKISDRPRCVTAFDDAELW